MTGPRDPTHSQAQILVGQRLHPQSPLYNMAFAFVFPAELRADVFCEAWRRVAGASDALRTRVGSDGRDGSGLFVAEEIPRTAVVDFASHPDPEAAFRQWCRDRCAQPFPAGVALVDSVLAPLGGGRTGWYLNQHHLVADAWSTRLIYELVAAEYEALLAGGHGERPPLPSYYATVASLPSRAGERPAARAHWTARADRASRAVALYGIRPGAAGTASIRSTLQLDSSRSRAIDRLSMEEGFVSLSAELSRFALFAALLSGWLSRISGRSEVGFDAPVAGRPTSDAKRAPGVFIELFPFAVAVEPGDTFRSLGARCLEEAKRLLQHALPGLSAPSGSTASSVVLNYVPGAFGAFAGVQPGVEWIHSGHGDSVHAARLQVHDFAGSGAYTFHLDLNTGTVPEPYRSRGLRHLERLLDAVLDAPDRPIAAIDLLQDDERAILATLNATDAAPLPDRSVVGLFVERAQREGGRVALRQGRAELSFAALLEQSAALAAALIAAGIEPGDRVAIAGRRSILSVVAILGTLRARAAYVPLDPFAPRARIDQAIEDSGARLVLVGEGVDQLSPPPHVQMLAVTDALRGRPGETAGLPEPRLDDLAYLLYTSGSTGRPKGVPIEHGGLADYLLWAERQYVRGDRLTFALFTALTFDLTVTSLFLPLITGGTLEIYPEPPGPVDTALMDAARADAADFVKLTPSHLALLRRIGLEGSRIRRLVVGGEDFKSSLAAAVSAQLHDRVEIYNEYGPTEAVVGCVAHRYEPGADTGVSVPIGRPADHVAVEILNEAQAAVPLGVPGELWISRYGLARGYHGLPGQTAERFQPHPGRPGARRYRTGDLVRIDASGGLEYLGRLDRQLKVSGFRVEPAEIEAALLSVAGIAQGAVIGRRNHGPAPAPDAPARHCIRCGLPSNVPRADLDGDGLCGACRVYDAIKDHARAYFRSMDDLRAVFEASSRTRTSSYDCLMLYSGGKDSTYALCRLVEMGLSVYAFTLDNGFIAESAKDNIRRVTAQLGVPIEFAATPAMHAIFRDSLMRFSNVCNGCFKTIYTLGMQRARALQIPIIVTGLSRGQLFETRLTGEMFRDGRRSPDEIDAAVLAARKVYHRAADEVSRALDVEAFRDDRIFEEVRFVDFYRYCDVGMEELYAYLARTVPWIRPAETGRSTNCLINDVGIYVHKKERGFHNYAQPYSWDVRLGHKTRAAALDELDDEIDVARVRRILADIGYDEERLGARAEQTALEAFYVAPEEIPDEELRRRLGERLPAQLIPLRLQRVESIPLTASGKVDEQALLRETGRTAGVPYRAPEGPVAEYLAGVWQEELGVARAGADDSFFELGGTSLTAMQVMIRLCREFDIDLPLSTLFTHPTLAALAREAEDRILADVADTED